MADTEDNGHIIWRWLPTINERIKKIYADSELEESATIRNFRIVQTEGSRQVTRDTKHYNLQMIIAVGFKANTERAVQFRKWVNQIAKDYTIKLNSLRVYGQSAVRADGLCRSWAAFTVSTVETVAGGSSVNLPCII